MFPTAQEIKDAVSIELAHMLGCGHNNGEIEAVLPKYSTVVRVYVRQGKLEYAKVIQHPKGIYPNISL